VTSQDDEDNLCYLRHLKSVFMLQRGVFFFS